MLIISHCGPSILVLCCFIDIMYLLLSGVCFSTLNACPSLVCSKIFYCVSLVCLSFVNNDSAAFFCESVLFH